MHRMLSICLVPRRFGLCHEARARDDTRVSNTEKSEGSDWAQSTNHTEVSLREKNVT